MRSKRLNILRGTLFLFVLSLVDCGVTLGGLDGNTLAGASDYFLSKYDSAGNK